MAIEKVNSSSSLSEVVDRILDKGIVIDAWIRISVVGIDFLTIEARVVVASVDTYLKYAEAIGLIVDRDRDRSFNFNSFNHRNSDRSNVSERSLRTLAPNNVVKLATK